jgi:GTP-binding protein Era
VSAVFRSGFCCFVGRPNAGKSTLTNALVGSKVAITSDKPQTTRRAIRGILNRPDGQLVVVDTPGFHRPRTLLGQRLNDIVLTTLNDVDVVGFCVPANQRIGPGDRFIAEQLKALRAPLIAVVTKTDTVRRDQVASQLSAIAALADFAEIVPVSALVNDQVDLLATLLLERVPEGPRLYPEDISTDEPEDVRIAELIREAALADLRDELPHSTAVTVEEMRPREGQPDLTEIFATIHVERDSQKGILIGAKGSQLKAIGTAARYQIEALLGTKVHLDLHVAIEFEWQRDAKKLDRLGL